jgi:hypothetical protein
MYQINEFLRLLDANGAAQISRVYASSASTVFRGKRWFRRALQIPRLLSGDAHLQTKRGDGIV